MNRGKTIERDEGSNNKKLKKIERTEYLESLTSTEVLDTTEITGTASTGGGTEIFTFFHKNINIVNLLTTSSVDKLAKCVLQHLLIR